MSTPQRRARPIARLRSWTAASSPSSAARTPGHERKEEEQSPRTRQRPPWRCGCSPRRRCDEQLNGSITHQIRSPEGPPTTHTQMYRDTVSYTHTNATRARRRLIYPCRASLLNTSSSASVSCDARKHILHPSFTMTGHFFFPFYCQRDKI